MKFTALLDTGTELSLGDDSAGDYIFDYQPDLPAKPEEVHFFGADYPKIIAHGLGANVRSWKVDREHADAATAFLFAEQHPSDVPLAFTLQISEGEDSVYLRATRSVVKPLERKGVNSVFQYTFLCGEVSTEAPT